jgi:hypothetical protein
VFLLQLVSCCTPRLPARCCSRCSRSLSAAAGGDAPNNPRAAEGEVRVEGEARVDGMEEGDVREEEEGVGATARDVATNGRARTHDPLSEVHATRDTSVEVEHIARSDRSRSIGERLGDTELALFIRFT